MFNGTTESLLEWITDLPIQQEKRVASCLRQYEAQLETPHAIPDQRLLQEAHQLLQERLQNTFSGNWELIHLAVPLYEHRCDYHMLYELLIRYSQSSQPLALYEQAWAWWQRVDCLALLRRYEVVLKEQECLLAWAQQHFPPEQCLFALNDATQALCWLEQKQESRWFAHCFQLLEQISPTQANRYDRFLLVRSAFTLLLRSKRTQEAQQMLQRLQHLEQEDPCWIRNAEIQVEHMALTIELLAQNPEQHTCTINALGHAADKKLAEWLARETSPLTSLQRRTVRRLAHNIGSELFLVQHYELAIPLFERAVLYGSMTPHTYLWLAGSLWQRDREAQRIRSLLVQAQARLNNPTRFQQLLQTLPELKGFPRL